MAIYSRNGSLINTVNDVSGGTLTQAFDVSGNVVFQSFHDLFSQRGKPSKSGKYLVGENGKQLELRGIGTHHILQYSNLHTRQAIESLKDYGVNMVRISIYLEDYIFASSDNEIAYGYISHPTETKQAIENLIDILVDLDMYVLLDWHVYSGGAVEGKGLIGPTLTPEEAFHKTEAAEFFSYFSQLYANTPNVMYELCNEPLKSSVSDVVAFAVPLINIIKNNIQNPVIVVGSADWSNVSSQYSAFQNANITDVFISSHNYGTNVSSTYRTSWNNGVPIFITEWGNSGSSGDGGGSVVNTQAMLDFYHETGIPNAFWKFTDQTMTTSALKNRGSINSSYYSNGFGDGDLSTNGTLFLKDNFLPFATTNHITRQVP